MSKKILLITVGGSDQPLVSSIIENNPDFVYFICSDDTDSLKGSYITVADEGKPCGEDRICPECNSNIGSRRTSIVSRTGLKKSQYEIIKISQLDDLNECYLAPSDIIKSIRNNDPSTKIVADYTGGTKSMSSGLAAAVMDDGNVEICIVRGRRKNLQIVEEGTQSARLIDNNKIFVKKKLLTIDLLWKNYDYQSCINLITDIFCNRPINEDTSKLLDNILELCKGFEAWDKFDHSAANKFLKGYKKEVGDHILFLGQIKCAKDNWPDSNNINIIEEMSIDKRVKIFNFSPVIDLILNASRRARQGRFDDAVARLYRALEMFAQVNLLLWEKPLLTSNLNLEKIPDKLRSKYNNLQNPDSNRVIFGLIQSYLLLKEIETPVGIIFSRHEQKLRQLLDKRNNSLMAHGINPVSEEDYQNIFSTFENFINEAFKSIDISKPNFEALQFPGDLLHRAKML